MMDVLESEQHQSRHGLLTDPHASKNLTLRNISANVSLMQRDLPWNLSFARWHDMRK